MTDRPRRLARTATLLLAACAVLATATSLSEPLAATRTGLAEGRWWSLWTGPLVHGDAGHLARDVAWTVGLFWVLAQRLSWPRWWGLLVVLLPLPTAASLACDDIDRYVGLSGLFYGLIAALAVNLLRTGRRRICGLLLLLGLAATLVADGVFGSLYWAEDGHRTLAVSAHVAGAFGGAILAAPRPAERRARRWVRTPVRPHPRSTTCPELCSTPGSRP